MSLALSHKQRVIEAQGQQIAALDAANNRLLSALSSLRQRYETQNPAQSTSGNNGNPASHCWVWRMRRDSGVKQKNSIFPLNWWMYKWISLPAPRPSLSLLFRISWKIPVTFGETFRSRTFEQLLVWELWMVRWPFRIISALPTDPFLNFNFCWDNF